MRPHSILVLKVLCFTLITFWGLYANFINLHLEQEVGLTGTQFGAVTTVSMLPVIVLTPILGYIGDKTKKHVLMLRISLLAISIMLCIFSISNTFLIILIVATLFEASRAIVPSFWDFIVTDHCARVGYDFGKVRVYGSYGFLIVIMGVGFMIAGVQIPWFGGNLGFEGFLGIREALFGTLIGLMLISFVCSFFVPDPNESETKGEASSSKFEWADVKALLANKPYLFIVLFSLLTMGTFETATMFFGNHLVVGLGASENILSWLTLIMVGPEFILLPMGYRIINKMGFKNFYLFTVLIMIARTLVYSFTGSVALFAAVSVVHGTGVVMNILGNLVFIRKAVPKKALGLALSIMMSLVALSRAILSVVYGALYEQFDGFAVFQMATALLICGFLLALRSNALKEVGDEITLQA